jgi:hypothetical protein
VVKRRALALRARAKALAEMPTLAAPTATKALLKAKSTPHMELALAANTGTTKRWLIAEGDSWSDYAGTDILDALEQSARFNNMVKSVAADFDHVRYVDLRAVLPASKTLWANELHPKETGFKLAAKEIQNAIEAP